MPKVRWSCIHDWRTAGISNCWNLLGMRTSRWGLKELIAAGCRGCTCTLELAEGVRQVEPKLEVQVVGISVGTDAEAKLAFAVPTYAYGDKPIFLGSLSLKGFNAWLESLD